jgi:hypothetical protein
VVALCWLAAPALATPGAYTSKTAFLSALPLPAGTVDFESLANGALVSGTTQTPPGGSIGVVLPGPLADVLDPAGPALPLRVVENAVDNPASSGARSLGVVDPGNFHAFTAGSPLAFSFTAPTLGFGLTLITPEEPSGALFNGDAVLTVPGQATAALSLSDGTLIGTFGGRAYRAYFLGVVGAAPFSSATLDFGAGTPDSSFFANVDDLTVTLPEPGPHAGLAAGALLLARLGRRTSRKGNR